MVLKSLQSSLILSFLSHYFSYLYKHSLMHKLLTVPSDSFTGNFGVKAAEANGKCLEG
jgi:hypothetical protein